MSTASRCLSPILKACCRKSLDVSTIKVCPACSMRTETRRRWSRESVDVQVSQSQAIEGTPVDVPVPKKVSFICQLSVVSSQLLHSAGASTDNELLTTDGLYFPPVISLALNFAGEGVGAFVNETYCMRKSANRLSSVCAS